MSKRRNRDAAFKVRVALEGERRVSELATAFEVDPTMIHQWKKALLEGGSCSVNATSTVTGRLAPHA